MAQQVSWQLRISGPEREETISIPEGETRIGRRPQNDLVLSHPFVSGSHALLTCADKQCTLTDLESTNGTSVDGEPLPANQPLPLAAGTTITIGPFTLTLVATEAEVEEPGEQAPAAEGERREAEAEASTPAEAVAGTEEIAVTGAEVAPGARRETVSPPPAPPPPPASRENGNILEPDPAQPLPGLAFESRRLLPYLPGIYHTDFMRRFLAIFEAILTPVEWTVDNFDLFLSPRTAPAGFLPWLANWYTLTFDATWSEGQRRALLADAPEIYARRGTRWALSRVLEIYTGRAPQIIEFEDEDQPFTFTVRLPHARHELNSALLERIIDAHKPAHTLYRLRFADE